MVLRLKPIQKKKKRVLDRTKALYGPRTQAYGETKCKKEKITSFVQNQGLAWSSDLSLWGNQLPGWESPQLKYCKMLRPVRVLG